jgi:cytosine/adenosine deaminase-related metal-dependent hydrolase
MIVTADWVLPVTGPPIAGGAVLTDDTGRISEVGPLAGVVAAAPHDTLERFDGCVIVPGLVNAHTHLSLTVLAGLVPPMPMRPFLARVTAAIDAMSDAEFAASAALGALDSLRCGVTCVGDIAYGPDPLAACDRLGLAGVVFWEVLGVEADDLDATLEKGGFPRTRAACAQGRLRAGLSPHTPYTVGPETLRAAAAIARETGATLAIHVAESPAERQLMLEGTGPLAEVATRLAHGFRPPGTGSVAYLERLGILHDTFAVHCANLEPGDPELLASARGVALCPRSNVWLGNGAPELAPLRDAGVRLTLGTDSPASNRDLDLFEEARAALALDPALDPARLLEMLTVDGARALGMDDAVGALAAGLQADLTVVRTGATADPEASVMELGGRGRIEAVMTAGRWRVRAGESTEPVAPIEHAAAEAHAIAAAAIAAAS